MQVQCAGTRISLSDVDFVYTHLAIVMENGPCTNGITIAQRAVNFTWSQFPSAASFAQQSNAGLSGRSRCAYDQIQVAVTIKIPHREAIV